LLSSFLTHPWRQCLGNCSDRTIIRKWQRLWVHSVLQNAIVRVKSEYLFIQSIFIYSIWHGKIVSGKWSILLKTQNDVIGKKPQTLEAAILGSYLWTTKTCSFNTYVYWAELCSGTQTEMLIYGVAYSFPISMHFCRLAWELVLFSLVLRPQDFGTCISLTHHCIINIQHNSWHLVGNLLR
jgi:hypothetical protein